MTQRLLGGHGGEGMRHISHNFRPRILSRTAIPVLARSRSRRYHEDLNFGYKTELFLWRAGIVVRTEIIVQTQISRMYGPW